MALRLLLLALLAGCSGLDDAAEADGGASADGSVGGDGGAACLRLASAAPDWLVGAIEEDVAILAGAMALPAGGLLVDRATVGNRALARAFLQDRFSEQEYVYFDHSYGSGINVYAELTADAPPDPDAVESIVIGAHYDTVDSSPGANDNASGVAIVLALARALAQTTCRTRTVLFVFFDEEEIGLVGSAAFADELLAQDQNVHSVHTVDQMGWDQSGNRGIELEKPASELLPTYMQVAQDRSIPLSTTPVDTTDHEAFRERGFTAVGLTEEFFGGDTTPHYHLPSDTADTVDVDYAASTAWMWGEVLDIFASEQVSN